MFVNSGSSEHFIDPKLIRGDGSRMISHTEMNPPIEIKVTGDNTPFGIEQGILLILVRDMQDVCRSVKLLSLFFHSFGSSSSLRQGLSLVLAYFQFS